MRLIDGDALKTDLTRFYDNEVTAKRLIDEQPTIDAIPVEWLHGMARRTEAQAEPHFAFMYVLHEWQESKPIEVQQAESEMRDWKREQEAHGT